MSLYNLIFWFLSLLGVSNGPCPTAAHTAFGAAQIGGGCQPSADQLSHARTEEGVEPEWEPNGPLEAATRPIDEISNGF